MSTLDIPDPATSPTFGTPPVDPAAVPVPDPTEHLPTATAEPEQGLDNLPRSGSACRFCGMRAAADATRVGGTFRLPPDVKPPADATEVRRVLARREMDAIAWQRARDARAAGDMAAYGRARTPPVVQEVTVPRWRVCAACVVLGNGPEAADLTLAAMGQPAPFPHTPTVLYVIQRHQVTPYHAAGGKPADRGSRDPWAHGTEALTAAAALLAELEAAGGVPAPIGPGCGICGRSHSPYGWREASWRPPGTASATPPAVALCDGFRWERGDRSKHPRAEPTRRRVGCGYIVALPAEAGPLVERIHAAALAAGSEAPHPRGVLSDDRDRFMAWTHPDFHRLPGLRAPWWHLADVPVAPPSAEERLAELERRLVGATT